MARKPGKRHSGSDREPVTIDLGSEDVKRVEEAAAGEGGPTETDLAARDYGAGAAEDVPLATEAVEETGDDATSSATAEEQETPPEERETEEAAEAELAAKDYGAGDDDTAGPAQVEEEGPADAAREPERRSALLATLGGGVVGAVIALAVAGGASYLGLIPSGDRDSGARIEQLTSDIASLREQVETSGAATADMPPEVTRALEDVRGETGSLANTVRALQDDLAEFRQAVAAGGADGDGSALAGESSARFDAIENRLGALSDALDALKLAATDAAERAGEAAQTAATSAEDAAASAQGLEDRIASLDERVSALAGRVSDTTGQEQVARTVAATALKSAIDRGAPFMSDLETFASVAGGSPATDALREMAASGVPTRGEISEQADEAAFAMIDAAQAPPADAGLLDRLAASAKSLVKVRPTGEVEGESVAAIVARMEAAIQGGDYAKAIAEYESLPDGAREAGANFAAKVKARMEADRLIDDVLASVLKPQQ